MACCECCGTFCSDSADVQVGLRIHNLIIYMLVIRPYADNVYSDQSTPLQSDLIVTMSNIVILSYQRTV